MGQDPTLDFLKDLDNPAKFVCRRGVPIARALKQDRQDGKPLVISDDDLPGIAETTAAYEADSGVVMRVTVGHVKPGVGQEEQPRLVGYARNPRVGQFGPGQTKGILADVYLMRQFADSGEADQYPFRSMEYRIDSGRISGLALLKTDPFCALGMVQFQADGSAQIAFMESHEMGDQTPPPVAGQEPPPAAGKATELTPEDKQKADMLFAYFMQANPWLAKCQAEYGKEDQSQKPDDKGDDDKKNDKGDDDMADKDAAKMQADLEASKAELAKFAKAADEAKVDALLAKFEGEGYEFDAAFERDALLTFSADKRDAYLANARKRYPKKPVGDMLGIYRGSVEGGGTNGKELDRDGLNAALAMMEADPSLTFPLARARVLKG